MTALTPYPGLVDGSNGIVLYPALSLLNTGIVDLGGTPGTYTPGVANLLITGHAPAVLGPLTPSASSLLLTGHSPFIGLNTDYSPATATLLITGWTPLLSRSQIIQPSAGSLLLTGGQPVLSFRTNYTPSAASLLMTGDVPDLTISSASQALELEDGTGVILAENGDRIVTE